MCVAQQWFLCVYHIIRIDEFARDTYARADCNDAVKTIILLGSECHDSTINLISAWLFSFLFLSHVHILANCERDIFVRNTVLNILILHIVKNYYTYTFAFICFGVVLVILHVECINKLFYGFKVGKEYSWFIYIENSLYCIQSLSSYGIRVWSSTSCDSRSVRLNSTLKSLLRIVLKKRSLHDASCLHDDL